MKSLLVIILTFLLSNFVFCNNDLIIERLSYDHNHNLKYTFMIFKDYFNGEPIQIRHIIKNISENNETINYRYSKTGNFFITGSRYFPPMCIPSPPSNNPIPTITLGPNEYIIEEHLTQAVGANLDMIFPTGQYSIEALNSKIPFVVENIENDTVIPTICYLNHMVLSKGLTDIDRIIEMCLSTKERCKNKDLIVFLDYFYCIKSVDFYNFAQKNSERFPLEVYNKSKYKIDDPIKVCYEFLNKYPDEVYFSQEIKKVLFEEIAKKGKEDFVKMMTEDFDYFNIHHGELILLLDKYNKLYNTNFKWNLL